jgi:hypothetical protein
MNASDVKQQNERRLQELGVAVNPSLPQIEQPSQLRPRPPQQVATRAWVLSYVLGVGSGRSADDVLDQLRATDLLDFLTPRERSFLRKPKFTHSDRAWAACLCEAAHGCAWAMGLLETGPLEKSPPRLISHFPHGDPHPAIGSARLRPFDDLYIRADLNYRLHWSARQARFEGSPFPLPEAHIQLRRHALDWIIGMPYDWDDIPLDT